MFRQFSPFSAGKTTGNPGSGIVPQYASSKITLFVFPPAGEGGFGQMMYRSPERSLQDSRDDFFLYSAQASFSCRHIKFGKQNTAMLIVLRENLLYKTSTRHRKNSKQSGIVAIDSCFALFGARQYELTTRENSDEKYRHTLI